MGAFDAAGIRSIELHERALLSRLLNGSENIRGLRCMDNVKVFLDYEDLTKRDLILAIGIGNLEHAQAVREYGVDPAEMARECGIDPF